MSEIPTITECRLQEIWHERECQEQKWGEQNHAPDTWLTIIAEELGEAAKACLEGDGQGYRMEKCSFDCYLKKI